MLVIMASFAWKIATLSNVDYGGREIIELLGCEDFSYGVEIFFLESFV